MSATLKCLLAFAGTFIICNTCNAEAHSSLATDRHRTLLAVPGFDAPNINVEGCEGAIGARWIKLDNDGSWRLQVLFDVQGYRKLFNDETRIGISFADADISLKFLSQMTSQGMIPMALKAFRGTTVFGQLLSPSGRTILLDVKDGNVLSGYIVALEKLGASLLLDSKLESIFGTDEVPPFLKFLRSQEAFGDTEDYVRKLDSDTQITVICRKPNSIAPIPGFEESGIII